MTGATPRLRLLFVTPAPPRDDAHAGGSRVMAQLIAALAARHRVALIYLQSASDQPLGAVQDACEWSESIPVPAPTTAGGRVGRRAVLAAGLVRGRPLWPGRLWVPDAVGRIRARVLSWTPDIVQFEYHVTGQYAVALDGCPAGRVLVQHEPGTAAARAALTGTRGWRRLLARADTLAWKSYERRIMRNVDRVVAFTDDDRRLLQPLAGSTPVIRIPFGIAVPPEPSPPAAEQADTLLFVGSFRHPPNEDAAARLLAVIHPRVRARLPGARLVIVGSDPPSWLLRQQEPGVEVAASVPDVRPYLERAAVVVAPLHLGGGMRVKVLESLAAGKAMVATPLAVAGLGVADGDQLRIGATDEAIADITVELMRDPSARLALGARAHQWAVANLSWQAPIGAYEELYRSIAPSHTVQLPR